MTNFLILTFGSVAVLGYVLTVNAIFAWLDYLDEVREMNEYIRILEDFFDESE